MEGVTRGGTPIANRRRSVSMGRPEAVWTVRCPTKDNLSLPCGMWVGERRTSTAVRTDPCRTPRFIQGWR